jgi:hypothetical protein
MAVEGAGGADVVVSIVAVDEQSVGTEDFFGELRLAEELIETDGEELRLGGEAGLRGVGGGDGSEGDALGARFAGADVLAGDAGGEQSEGLGLFDEGLEFVKECGAVGGFWNEDDAGLGAELAGA